MVQLKLFASTKIGNKKAPEVNMKPQGFSNSFDIRFFGNNKF